VLRSSLEASARVHCITMLMEAVKGRDVVRKGGLRLMFCTLEVWICLANYMNRELTRDL